MHEYVPRFLYNLIYVLDYSASAHNFDAVFA